MPALSWELLRLGAVAFGGLGATLALLQRGLVDRRQWLQERDISEALAFTQALPGSTGVQVVAYLGWRLCGWPGAVVAPAAFVAPAAAMMIAVAAASLALPSEPWVNGALTGVQVAVIGLVAAAMWRLAGNNAKGRALAAALVAGGVLGFIAPAATVVIGIGLIGALIDRERKDG